MTHLNTKEHITQYLSTVHSPGTEELELQEIEKVSETDAGLLVQATVVSYIRIGPCDLLKVPQPVSFVVCESGGNISIETSHNWISAWEFFWLSERFSCLEAARAEIESAFGPWDEADPAHLAALLLLLSEDIGPCTTLLAKIAGRPEVEIEHIAIRLRDALIWKDDLVDSAAWHKSNGQLAFLLDVMVGVGQLERRMSAQDAEYRYHAVNPDGPTVAQRENSHATANFETDGGDEHE
jgi:hypothetical protein